MGLIPNLLPGGQDHDPNDVTHYTPDIGGLAIEGCADVTVEKAYGGLPVIIAMSGLDKVVDLNR